MADTEDTQRHGLDNQFGKLHGVSAGAVKRWESGKVRVTKGGG